MRYSHHKFLRQYRRWARPIGRGAQSKLAQGTAVSPSSALRWIAGVSVPRQSKLPLIAAVLGCTVQDLCLKENGR